MKLSQKKNCNSCRAGWYNTQPFEHKCNLQIPVKNGNYEGIPLSPCFKPLTNKDYIFVRSLEGLL
jgi:hypothetical protein